MSQDRYIYLIYKELQDSLTDGENKELEQWLNASAEHHALKAEIIGTVSNLDTKPPIFEVDVEADYAKVASRLGFDSVKGPKPASSKRYLWWLIGAFLLGMGAAAVYFQSNSPQTPVLRALNAEAEIQEIELADGSKIKLNAGSTLEYPEDFEEDTRSVYLKGEAYFDIKKDETKPFIIHTAQSQIEVLGTSFNVREDNKLNETIVAVLTGKVRLSSAHNTLNTVVLSKNEKGIITDSNEALKVKSDNLNALAWNTGKLRFKSTKVGEVFGDMAAFYDVSIINKSSITDSCTYSMSSQAIGLDRLLENMNQIFHFQIERKSEDVIVISEGNCN